MSKALKAGYCRQQSKQLNELPNSINTFYSRRGRGVPQEIGMSSLQNCETLKHSHFGGSVAPTDVKLSPTSSLPGGMASGSLELCSFLGLHVEHAKYQMMARFSRPSPGPDKTTVVTTVAFSSLKAIPY